MECPTCGGGTRVVDSRATEDGAIRRRRECSRCEHRFTTYERLAELEPTVVKRDGRREPFQLDKLLNGIRIAFIKRPVPQSEVEGVAEAVRLRAVHQSRGEISSSEIGDWTLEGIRRLDPVAAFRFASVLRRPDDIEGLQRELAAIRDAPASAPGEPASQPALPLEGANRSTDQTGEPSSASD